MAEAGKIKEIEQKARKAISEYSLLKKREKVIAACSGGKDSTVLLYILKKNGYNVEAATIDPSIADSTEKNLDNLKSFCEKHSIKLHIYSYKQEFGHTLYSIRKKLDKNGIGMAYCTICGILKRYLLNKKARDLGASKIATGHNLDDEAESVLMNLFRGSPALLARLGPCSGVLSSSAFVPRVKPLYFCMEKDIAQASKAMGFPVAYERCPYAKSSYREIVRNELEAFEKKHPGSKKAIIDFFISAMPQLKKSFGSGSLSYCSNCGEPSSRKECRACAIIKHLDA